MGKRILSVLLCLALLCCSINITAFAAEINDQKTVYVDGKAFVYSIASDGTLEVQGKSDNGKSYLTILPDGTAEAQAMDETGQYIQYELEINDLSLEKVDVTATHESSTFARGLQRTQIVEHFTCVEDIMGKSYVGQASLVVVTGISLSTLLTVVLTITGTIVVGGCIYYAVANVIEKIKSDSAKQKYYYKAHIADYVTYIAFYSGTITQSQAASRIKSGQNVYTYTKSLAKAAVVSAGLGCITSPEIHLRSGALTFYHYHTANRNGAHSLYGLPYTK